VIARNIQTDKASIGVMLSSLVGDSSAIVDGCEFTGSADYYGALALEIITDVTLTSNKMDGPLFAFDVSGLIQDNTIMGGSGKLGAIYLSEVNNSLISGNHVEQFTIYDPWRAGIYMWASDFNIVTENTFVDVLGDGVGVAAIRARGESTGNSIRLNTYTHSGLPGWNESNGYSGPGAVWLDESTTLNVVRENKFPPINGPAICQMILDPGEGNTVLNWKPCENISW
jgi:parallel beta-helix repeat protein